MLYLMWIAVIAVLIAFAMAVVIAALYGFSWLYQCAMCTYICLFAVLLSGMMSSPGPKMWGVLSGGLIVFLFGLLCSGDVEFMERDQMSRTQRGLPRLRLRHGE